MATEAKNHAGVEEEEEEDEGEDEDGEEEEEDEEEEEEEKCCAVGQQPSEASHLFKAHKAL